MQLSTDFKELRGVAASDLMYVKEVRLQCVLLPRHIQDSNADGVTHWPGQCSPWYCPKLQHVASFKRALSVGTGHHPPT